MIRSSIGSCRVVDRPGRRRRGAAGAAVALAPGVGLAGVSRVVWTGSVRVPSMKQKPNNLKAFFTRLRKLQKPNSETLGRGLPYLSSDSLDGK